MKISAKFQSNSNIYLDDLSKTIPTALQRALKTAGEEAKDLARKNIRDKNIIDSGALMDSINVYENFETSKTPWIKIQADYPDMSKVNSVRKTPISKQIYYAFAVEYGSRDTPPRPYLQPAKVVVEDKIEDYFFDEVQKEIDVYD